MGKSDGCWVFAGETLVLVLDDTSTQWPVIVAVGSLYAGVSCVLLTVPIYGDSILLLMS